MKPAIKARWLTSAIILTFGLFGLVCHWKPAYGLIVFLSVAFTCATQFIYLTLKEHLVHHEHDKA